MTQDNPKADQEQRVNEFKVNAWMIKLGFHWDITPGTPANPNPFNGLWVKDGNAFSQEQAVFWYQTLHVKKWWRFWL
jgi:hypothetical protein